MRKVITTPEKLVRLSWQGRHGVETYVFNVVDALKVIEQMSVHYSPISIWIYNISHSPERL